MTIVFGVILIFEQITFEQRPAFHIITLTFLPVLLFDDSSAIRLLGVTEALPAGKSEILKQAWIYILLTVFIPFLYLINFCELSSHTARFAGAECLRIDWPGANTNRSF